MTRARLLVDECLSVALAPLARSRGYEAMHLRDLGRLGLPDAEVARLALEGDWCLVTRNARDFRGPDGARGSAGEYAGVSLHAGLVCLHGPPGGFAGADQLEAFAVALDLLDEGGGDATNLLVEVSWTEGCIDFEVVEFPPPS